MKSFEPTRKLVFFAAVAAMVLVGTQGFESAHAQPGDVPAAPLATPNPVVAPVSTPDPTLNTSPAPAATRAPTAVPTVAPTAAPTATPAPTPTPQTFATPSATAAPVVAPSPSIAPATGAAAVNGKSVAGNESADGTKGTTISDASKTSETPKIQNKEAKGDATKNPNASAEAKNDAAADQLTGALNPGPSATPVPDHTDLSLDQAGGLTLTLQGSIDMAVQGASSVLKAENDTHYAGTHLLQAYGQFLPSVYGQGNYGYTSGKTYYTTTVPTSVDGAGRNSSYALTADLNLFNGLADYSNLRSSLLKKSYADLTLTRAQQQINLDVTQSFLQVILDEKLVNISRKNLQASQERERLLKEQTEVGVKNLSDLFRQQAQTSQDESALLSAENKSRTDQIILLRKIRLEPSKQYHFVEPTIPENRSPESLRGEDDLIAAGLKQRVDLQAFSDRADAFHWDVHSAFSTYLPKLDLLGQISSVGHTLDRQNVNGNDLVLPNQADVWSQLGHQVQYTVGLTLTWTFFDRFVTAQNISQARVNADDADVDAQDKKLQVEGEVRQSFGDYQTALDQLKSSKKGLEAAQKAYEVMNGRYGVGAASFLDLVTTQTVLVQAESARAQALINFELQEKALNFALGKDL